MHEREGARSRSCSTRSTDRRTARGISYWAISLCALDADGPLAALVVNQATGERTTAIRGKGAHRDDVELRASNVTAVEKRSSRCRAFRRRRCRGSSSARSGARRSMLCDVAAGGLDGLHRLRAEPCTVGLPRRLPRVREAGAIVRDANGDELVTADPDARRQVIAAGTPRLADA